MRMVTMAMQTRISNNVNARRMSTSFEKASPAFRSGLKVKTQKATTARYGVLDDTHSCRGTRHREPGWLLTKDDCQRISATVKRNLATPKNLITLGNRRFQTLRNRASCNTIAVALSNTEVFHGGARRGLAALQMECAHETRRKIADVRGCCPRHPR
jgi:hypothetical protein